MKISILLQIISLQKDKMYWLIEKIVSLNMIKKSNKNQIVSTRTQVQTKSTQKYKD